jgi:hypothetical protein
LVSFFASSLVSGFLQLFGPNETEKLHLMVVEISSQLDELGGKNGMQMCSDPSFLLLKHSSIDFFFFS